MPTDWIPTDRRSHPMEGLVVTDLHGREWRVDPADTPDSEGRLTYRFVDPANP